MTLDLTCRELVEFASDYLEQALPARERVRCEQHLVLCTGCARYLDQMRAVVRLAGTLAAEDELGEAGRERLLAALDAWRSRRR
ncbi:MAG TPA: zf-HC2 domain-containing protein [Gaiellaceae bacterium]|nr:zf-HC2 domain-containing protein [Gaiellaceae bacterium]